MLCNFAKLRQVIVASCTLALCNDSLYLCRLYKKVWNPRTFVPRTEPFIKKSITGLTLILTTLEGHPQKNRLSEYVAARISLPPACRCSWNWSFSNLLQIIVVIYPSNCMIRIAHDIFWRLHERGFIVEKSVDQLFCEQCSRWVSNAAYH